MWLDSFHEIAGLDRPAYSGASAVSLSRSVLGLPPAGDRPAEVRPLAGAVPAEGGARRFPCPKDTISSPYVARVVEAGRASVAYRVPSRGDSSWVAGEGGLEYRVDAWGEVLGSRVAVSEGDRVARNRERAARRARRAVEDYVVVNECTKMWTFTYAEKCWDRSQCVADVHEFVQRWRDFESRPFPYVYVIEQHQDGSFHVHFAVRHDHFTDFFVLRRLWGHGRVRFDKQRKGRDSSRRSKARLASYMTKYLVKAFDDVAVRGQHSYEVGEGFQPSSEVRYFASFAEASEWVARMNPQLEMVWFSGDYPDSGVPIPCWCFEERS